MGSHELEESQRCVVICESCVGLCIVSVVFKRLFEKPDGLLQAFLCPLIPELSPTQVIDIGFWIDRGSAFFPTRGATEYMLTQSLRHMAGNVALDRKYISDLTVIILRPLWLL